MFKGLSSATFKKALIGTKNHSEQQLEGDELDSAYRLDCTCQIFVQNFAFFRSISVWNESFKYSNL